MPSALTFPGIYIEEIPSGVRTITGVSTSNTAFVDYFIRGPLNTAVRITSFADFERVFGGVQRDSEASYAIKQYYLNGGSVAFVVRVAAGTPASATVTLQGGSGPQATLAINATSPGEWANNAVQVAAVQAGADRFNLFVREVAVQDGSVVLHNGKPQVLAVEDFRNLTMDTTSADYVVSVLEDSELIDAVDMGLGDPPTRPAPPPGHPRTRRRGRLPAAVP
jgi:phage tail sheath protein FI